jgi:hypothetical protein
VKPAGSIGLAALADNGGPTMTRALMLGSPAIDAGNPSGCTDSSAVMLTIDQRGGPRPLGSRCDIGAFEFGSGKPIVQTGDAANVTPTTATIAGTVNPDAVATTAHFEWGTTTSYGNTTPDQSVGAGSTAQSVSANLTGLAPSTTVHYRVVATNGLGTSSGEDKTFTTPAATARLTVSVKGKGTVTSTPTGITCPKTCSASFDVGTTVALKPHPAKGWHFAKWKGACTGSKTCGPRMSAAEKVTAVFVKSRR